MEVPGGETLALLSNSESTAAVDGRSQGRGVSSLSERGTTQTGVKAPKCRLSVNPKEVPGRRQRGGRLRSSHPLKSA